MIIIFRSGIAHVQRHATKDRRSRASRRLAPYPVFVGGTHMNAMKKLAGAFALVMVLASGTMAQIDKVTVRIDGLA